MSYHKYDPRRVMEWLSMYLFIIFGFIFGLYSFYLMYQTGELFYAGAAVAGMMLAFNQADRNVYYKRLNNLMRELGEADLGIEIERVEYTDYQITEQEE